MARVFHSRFKRPLRLRSHAGDPIREQLAAIVQKTFENTDIAIINIRDITQLERIDFLFIRIALRTLVGSVLSLLSGALVLPVASGGS